MSDKIALYGRISTKNQTLQNQEEKLKRYAEAHGDEYDLITEQASSVGERPKFQELMDNLDEYDKLVVTKLDRFGRNLRDILKKVEELQNHNVDLITTDEAVDTSGEMGDIMLKFLAIFSEFERKQIRNRLEEGFKKAKEEGRVGRPQVLSEEEKRELASLYESGNYTWKGLTNKFGVSKTTISKVLKEKGLL